MEIFDEDMIAALESPEARVFYAVRLDWPTGTTRLHTEIGTFTHFPFDQGESYYGVGNLGGVGDTTYGDGDETSPSITLELSVKDEALRTQILSGGYQGRKGELFLVAMDEVGRVLAWALVFDGVMDSGNIKQGDSNVIQLPLTSLDDALEKGLNWRCTEESHKADYADDDFYKYSKFMEDLTLYWGNKKDGTPLRNL